MATYKISSEDATINGQAAYPKDDRAEASVAAGKPALFKTTHGIKRLFPADQYNEDGADLYIVLK